MERKETHNTAGRRFRLIERIGKGGFGEVYLTELSTPTGFTKTVAVKLLRSDIQQQQATAQRMRDEARLLGMLRHRSIVQAEDLITLAGRTAVVMEFIPGVNHSWIIHPKRYPDDIPPRVTLTIIGHIADALDAAYNRPSTVTGKPLQVLHRDIKPGNVRITPDGEVKVLDFGIARSDHMNREATTTEYQLGSLPYMAPELMAGKGASTASDIYSLGVTFYESLGRRRFGWAGDSPEAHLQQIETRFGDIDWTPFEDAAEEAQALLTSMLAFDPRERPSARSILEKTRELEHRSPGVSLESWAPDALAKIENPEKNEKESGELVGQVLFEEVSTSAVDRQDLMDQIDDATMALTQQEMLEAREAVTGPLPKTAPKPSWVTIRDRLVLLVLLLATIGTAFTLSRQNEDPLPSNSPPVRTAPAMNTEAPVNAEPALTEPPTEPVDSEPEEDPAPTVTAVAPPAPAPAPAAVAPRPEPVVEAPVVDTDPVTVKINSQPFGISVLVDGELVGSTPIPSLSLEPGPHILLFQDGEHSIRKEIVVSPTGKTSWKYFQAEQKIR